MAQNTSTPTAEIRPSRFVIDPEEAETMRQEMGIAALRDLLPALLPEAQKLARPAISRFHVGAAALGTSGRIYLGANIEFPGVPLHHSIHAEQFLITNAALHAEPSIRFIAVSEFPCGHCRQFLQEIRNASQIQILITGGSGGGSGDFRPVSYFLPNPFSPSDLLHRDTPLLLEPHFNDLIEEVEEVRVINSGLEERLKMAALKVARASHAPYSGSASGFALADDQGRVYAGSYTESAAYNPSLGPVQAAIVAYLAAGGGGGGGGVGEGIVAGVLAERQGAAVSQEETARILFSAVAPKARFSVYRLRVPAGSA
ncbi:cytidine deaminase 1 [Dendrobium catenatum]|uniref:cytidine deaminase n=1 Tax=Dendrobium catenatum TaxID=906689 RepID=A0A2I0VTS4_9ASPA|nr:cytidine deaminase 1 [Dendrobium catenatum]PKU66818.1 cytidine deaminase [Dendrobium catenatum]